MGFIRRTIKDWIYKKYFKAEEQRLVDFYRELRDQAVKELTDSTKELRSYREQQKIINSIFSKGHEIIGMEENKKGYPLIIAKSEDQHDLEIYLHSKYYNRPWPTLTSTIYTNPQSGAKVITIHDVQMIDNSIGNGNIAMKYFLVQAKRIGAKEIKGSLSPRDKDNFIRSIPYYKKFGFKVNLNEAETEGSIKLLIK